MRELWIRVMPNLGETEKEKLISMTREICSVPRAL